ncbi:putative thioredoxin [Diplocarpon rosae]|nr:putative thioredoxin [Diplocarpon rosae]
MSLFARTFTHKTYRPISTLITSESITQTRNFSSTVAKMGVHNLANKAEFAAALKDHKILILDAFATWCGPCKVIAPQVVKFSEEFPDAHFAKLDVDEVPDVAQELGIRAMPTFVIFKDGEKFKEIVGANPQALKLAIQASLPGADEK